MPFTMESQPVGAFSSSSVFADFDPEFADWLARRSVLHAKSTLSKTKRGLPGFANGSRISAFPDTGSSRNVVSEAFVRELKLDVIGSPCEFKLGNSQTTKSIGELLLIFVQMVRWLMDNLRHGELRLGIFGMCHRYDEDRLRCTSLV